MSPRVADPFTGIDNHERSPSLFEVVGHRKASLATADDQRLDMPWRSHTPNGRSGVGDRT